MSRSELRDNCGTGDVATQAAGTDHVAVEQPGLRELGGAAVATARWVPRRTERKYSVWAMRQRDLGTDSPMALLRRTRLATGVTVPCLARECDHFADRRIPARLPGWCSPSPCRSPANITEGIGGSIRAARLRRPHRRDRVSPGD